MPVFSQRDISWADEAAESLPAGTVAAVNEAAEKTIVKEHAFPRGEKDPEPPAKRIEVNGARYELVSAEEADAESEPERSVFTYGYSVQCAPEDLDATLASVPAEWGIDEAGFKGAIPRVSLETSPHYGTRDYQADVVQTYFGLKSNDVSQIPMSAAFTLDTGNTQTLECAGITWSVEETDDRGLPSSYSAVVTYRGVDQVQIIEFYEVTAQYEGTVKGPRKPLTKVVATYELRVPETVDLSDKAPDVRAFSLPIWSLALGGGATAAACVLLIVPIWRRRQCTVAVQEVGFAPLADEPSFSGSLVKLMRLRVKKTADGCSVDLPTKLVADGCGAVVLLFRKSIADGRPMRITWGNRVVYEGPLRDVVRIPL